VALTPVATTVPLDAAPANDVPPTPLARLLNEQLRVLSLQLEVLRKSRPATTE
jgi:hypothetical protein